jgi:hypothetical protein
VTQAENPARPSTHFNVPQEQSSRALLVLTGAWLLTVIRTEKRPFRMRLLETTALAVACPGVVVVVLGGAAFLNAFL